MARNGISLTPLSLCALVAAVLLTGCSSPPAKNTSGIGEEPNFVTFASLAPSNTELVYSLNAQEQLVGVCDKCDYPEEVKDKARVGSFTSVDLEKLTMQHPQGVLLVNGQEALAHTLKSHNIPSVILSNNKVHDVSVNIKRLGRITHRSAMAISLCSEFDKHVDLIKNAMIVTKAKRPRVFFCVWTQPMVTVSPNSYLGDAITICGGTNIAEGMTGDYPQYSAEKLLMQQPDVIILPQEANTPDFLTKAPWSSLKAVKEHRVYFLPEKDKDYLSRPTLRLIKGLYWLESKIHPEIKLR